MVVLSLLPIKLLLVVFLKQLKGVEKEFKSFSTSFLKNLEGLLAISARRVLILARAF
jgi:hypothetical protein